jgi:hypothetical protein
MVFLAGDSRYIALKKGTTPSGFRGWGWSFLVVAQSGASVGMLKVVEELDKQWAMHGCWSGTMRGACWFRSGSSSGVKRGTKSWISCGAKHGFWSGTRCWSRSGVGSRNGTTRCGSWWGQAWVLERGQVFVLVWVMEWDKERDQVLSQVWDQEFDQQWG